MLNNDQFKSIIKQIRNTEEALRAEKSQSATLMECFQENQHEKLQAQLKSLFLRLTALENGLLREALQATNQSLIEHVRLMMDTFDEKLMGSLKFKKTLNKIIEKDSAYFGRSDQPLSAEGLKLDQKKALKEMKKTIFLVGSSRQSASTNNCNKRVRIPSLESMNGKKYVFQVDCAFAALKNLKKLFSEDNIELNRMLLPDCFNGLPLGATFARTRGLNCSEKNDLPVFDQNKVLIIYAQAHELAARHPNHLICLSLFDDREDILKALGDFLAKTPTMLPKNVKLALIQYNGKSSPTLRYVIQGTGCIDVAYSKTLLNMATQAMFALPLEKRRRGGTVDVTQLDPRLLGNFREPMTMKAFPFCKPTKEDVDRQLSTQSAPMFFTRGFKNQPEVDVMNTEVIGSKR